MRNSPTSVASSASAAAARAAGAAGARSMTDAPRRPPAAAEARPAPPNAATALTCSLFHFHQEKLFSVMIMQNRDATFFCSSRQEREKEFKVLRKFKAVEAGCIVFRKILGVSRKTMFALSIKWVSTLTVAEV